MDSFNCNGYNRPVIPAYEPESSLPDEFGKIAMTLDPSVEPRDDSEFEMPDDK